MTAHTGVRAFALAACVAALAAGAAPQPTARAVAAREDAYRANNIGVARLEQFDFEAAAASFRRALEIDPRLAIARMNLGIALFYGGDSDGCPARDRRGPDGPSRQAAPRLPARSHRPRSREDRGGNRRVHACRAPGSGRHRHGDQSWAAVPPGAEVPGSDRRISPRDGRGAVQRDGRVRPREHAHPGRPRRRRPRRDGALPAPQREQLRHHVLPGLPGAGPLRGGDHVDRGRGRTGRHTNPRGHVCGCDGDASFWPRARYGRSRCRQRRLVRSRWRRQSRSGRKRRGRRASVPERRRPFDRRHRGACSAPRRADRPRRCSLATTTTTVRPIWRCSVRRHQAPSPRSGVRVHRRHGRCGTGIADGEPAFRRVARRGSRRRPRFAGRRRRGRIASHPPLPQQRDRPLRRHHDRIRSRPRHVRARHRPDRLRQPARHRRAAGPRRRSSHPLPQPPRWNVPRRGRRMSGSGWMRGRRWRRSAT